jgi:hypothetical protein
LVRKLGLSSGNSSKWGCRRDFLATVSPVLMLKVEELSDVVLRISGLNSAKRRFIKVLNRRHAWAHNVGGCDDRRFSIRDGADLVGVQCLSCLWVSSITNHDRTGSIDINVGILLLERPDKLLLFLELGAVLSLGTVVRLGDDLFDADNGY